MSYKSLFCSLIAVPIIRDICLHNCDKASKSSKITKFLSHKNFESTLEELTMPERLLPFFFNFQSQIPVASPKTSGLKSSQLRQKQKVTACKANRDNTR